MPDPHPHIIKLLRAVELEEKEELARYRMDRQHNLKALKAEGLALHPIRVTQKSFGFADYPELSFRVPFPADTASFRDGAAIELFYGEEVPVKGVLLNFDGKQGELRLHAPDYPDWLEEDSVGIKRSPDTRTSTLMKQALRDLPKHRETFALFEQVYGAGMPSTEDANPNEMSSLHFRNKALNASQQAAVQAVVGPARLTILHGPPGTGKTTTLIEAIVQLLQRGEKVMVTAPGNTAVDHLARGLLQAGCKVLRVGNSTKIAEDILPHTPQGKLADKQLQKEIKSLKIRAEEFRKMALQYKRRFGKAEREQRHLLFQEVKSIRQEIRKLLSYHEEKLYAAAEVILGTPVALLDMKPSQQAIDTLVMDEAGQCLQPLAWAIFPLANKLVLAGDPFQLPPTVLSAEAMRMGLHASILEVCFGKTSRIFLLDTQYRMRRAIAEFSSAMFYEGRLKTPDNLRNESLHITFFDTAGTGYDEASGAEGSSLVNPGELESVRRILQADQLQASQTAFISPYAAQVLLARESLPGLRVSTIDSFQGQEYHTVVVSLVRSNDTGQIGFLNDTRRMNVALTRAQEQLYVVGDSATLGQHPFYRQLLEYIEQHGAYRSVWELENL